MIKALKYIFLGCVAILVFSCKHDPFPAQPIALPVDSTQTPVDTSTNKGCHPDTAYFKNDVLPIFIANCAYAGCHDATSASDGIILNNYDNVINTADVEGGDLDAGKLYEAITDSDPNKRMPLGQQALASADIATIRDWILQGALNNSCEDCDTTNLAYTDISPIIQSNCLNCHGSSNPANGRELSTYAQLKDALLNTNLLDRINDRNGASVMPVGGKMSDCNINKIEIWYNNGMPQ